MYPLASKFTRLIFPAVVLDLGFEGYEGYVAIDPGLMSLIDTSLRERELMVVQSTSIQTGSFAAKVTHS